EDRLRQMHVEFRAGAVERPHQNRFPLLPQLGSVIFARREDEGRHEAPEGIAPHEEPEALPFSQMENAHHDRVQVVVARLQELVARIGLDDIDERLSGVTSGGETRARDYLGRLAPEQRNVGRLRAVCSRGVETEEAMLAAHLPFCIEALDADVVEITGSMYGRARIGLRNDEKLRQPRER